jgi:hypothetical protein
VKAQCPTLSQPKAQDTVLIFNYNYSMLVLLQGAHSGAVVKALRYKSAGRGFDFRLCHWNFSVT